MEPLSSVVSNESIEINDYLFCTHGPDAGRELTAVAAQDNAFTAGVDPIPERDAIEVEYAMNKDGEPVCKAHRDGGCTKCYGFKKQIVKLTKEGQKRAKLEKKNKPVSNLIA
ncbi:hypothetical protein JCM21900_005871 [Sporobolomyces salmonicolor]